MYPYNHIFWQNEFALDAKTVRLRQVRSALLWDAVRAHRANVYKISVRADRDSICTKKNVAKPYATLVSGRTSPARRAENNFIDGSTKSAMYRLYP